LNYRKKFVVEPGSKLHLAKIDLSSSGKHKSHKTAIAEIAKEVERMDRLHTCSTPMQPSLSSLCCRPSMRPEKMGSLGTYLQG
jgi:hypothetical protein